MKYLNQFIKRGDALGRLQQAARKLDALARQVRGALPPEAAAHVSGCTVRSDSLVVFVDNAVWASQLRYQQNEILAVARNIFGPVVRRVRFKVLLPEAPSATRPVSTISPDSQRLLRQAASGVADEDLAEALRRLANQKDQDAD